MQGERSRAIAFALMAFVVGFSLDDVRVLRAPGYMVGLAGFLLFFSVGPFWMGRRAAVDHRHEPVEEFRTRMARARRVGGLSLLAVGLGGAFWLVFFASGVPAWAR